MLSATPHKGQDLSSSVGLVPRGSGAPTHKTPDPSQIGAFEYHLFELAARRTNDDLHVPSPFLVHRLAAFS